MHHVQRLMRGRVHGVLLLLVLLACGIGEAQAQSGDQAMATCQSAIQASCGPLYSCSCVDETSVGGDPNSCQVRGHGTVISSGAQFYMGPWPYNCALPPSSCEEGEIIDSNTGFLGAAPTGNVCSGGCTFGFSGEGGGEVCVADANGGGQTCTHYGSYTGTGEECTGPEGAEPDPDGRTCTDLGGGYTLCQKGEDGPPCIIGPNSTQCIHPPGPICLDLGAGGTMCIGDENGGTPPSPPDTDGDNEPPPTCGVANGRRVCHHPPDTDSDDDGTPDSEDEDDDGDGIPDDEDEDHGDNDEGDDDDGDGDDDQGPDCPASDPNCEDDSNDEMAGDAPCGSEPPCEGDAVGCAQLLKQHKIACEVDHSNTLLSDFRNKQLEEVRETNAKLASLQDKVTAEQKVTTDAIKRMAEEANRDANESNQRLANLNSKLSAELQATRQRIDRIAPDLTGPGQKTLSDLDAKLQAEITATNDMRDVLSAQYGDQEAILQLIADDAAGAHAKLEEIAIDTQTVDDKLGEMNTRATTGSAPGGCPGTISCGSDDAECARQRAMFAALCAAVDAQADTTEAVEAAAGQITGAVNGLDVDVDTSAMEANQQQTNSLLGDALNKLDALNNLALSMLSPLNALLSQADAVNSKLAAFGQEGVGSETFTPDESEWGPTADANDFLHDMSETESLLDDSGLGWSRTCPAPQTVVFRGTTIVLPTDMLCDWLEIGSALMLIITSLFCLRILSHGVST